MKRIDGEIAVDEASAGQYVLAAHYPVCAEWPVARTCREIRNAHPNWRVRIALRDSRALRFVNPRTRRVLNTNCVAVCRRSNVVCRGDGVQCRRLANQNFL